MSQGGGWAKIFDDDPIAGEPPVRLEDGAVVTVRVIGIDRLEKFDVARVVLRCAIQREDPGALMPTFTGGEIEWWLTLTASRKGKGVAPASLYYQAWTIVNGRPPARGDRMSPEIFRGKVLVVRTRLSKVNHLQMALPESLWTSKVAGLVSVANDVLQPRPAVTHSGTAG